MAYPKPTINDTELLWANSWEESYEVVENVLRSESGKDLVNIVRYDKLTVNASYRCTSDWAKIFKDFSQMPELTLKRYDASTGAVDTRFVRMRDFTMNLIQKSYLVGVSNGLWEISFSLIEM